MKKHLLFALLLFSLTISTYAQDVTATLAVKADSGKETISKYIYGHFTEHLGRCIYGGIWVGKNSPIPNMKANPGTGSGRTARAKRA